MNAKDILLPDSIRKFRNMRGISQEILAEQTGVSLAHMGRIEAGTRKPGIDTFLNILEVLEVKMYVEPGKGTKKEECYLIFNKIMEDCTNNQAVFITKMIIEMKEHLSECNFL